jgi:hypothetical protein
MIERMKPFESNKGVLRGCKPRLGVFDGERDNGIGDRTATFLKALEVGLSEVEF